MSITTVVVASEVVEDFDPSVSRCGECPEAGSVNAARWVVRYTGGNIDGDPVERSDYACDTCQPALLRYARHLNTKYHAFTPVELVELGLPAWVRAA